jgi:hypothetical protein
VYMICSLNVSGRSKTLVNKLSLFEPRICLSVESVTG